MIGLSKRVALLAGLLSVSACGALPQGNAVVGMGESSAHDAVEAAPESVQARFDAGLQDMNAQAWSDALREMEALWHEHPQYSGPALNVALIHQRQSRPELAEQWFQRSLQSNQANLDAHNAFAVFLREQGRYDEAREQYQAALAIAPEHAATHFNLGILYDLYLGEKASAVDHFSRYQELTAGESREVAGWIADLQRQLAQSHPGEGGAS